MSEPQQDIKPDAGEDCAECVTTSEKALAALGIGFGILIIAMAVDLATGGWVSRLVSRVMPAREPAEV